MIRFLIWFPKTVAEIAVRVVAMRKSTEQSVRNQSLPHNLDEEKRRSNIHFQALLHKVCRRYECIILWCPTVKVGVHFKGAETTFSAKEPPLPTLINNNECNFDFAVIGSKRRLQGGGGTFCLNMTLVRLWKPHGESAPLNWGKHCYYQFVDWIEMCSFSSSECQLSVLQI